MPNGRRQPEPSHQHQHCYQNKHEDVSGYAHRENGIPSEPYPARIVVPSRDADRGRRQEARELYGSVGHNLRLAQKQELVYYPAYCHKASSTWFEWVKLTACDIHTKLHIKDEYQHSWLVEQKYRRYAPQLMFYLNHPIQFVQVVGVVVSFDEYFERFWLFTIDDSSGMTIDVVCQKPPQEKANVQKTDGIVAKEPGDVDREEEREVMQLSDSVSTCVEIGTVLQVKGVITLFQRHKSQHILNKFGNGLIKHVPKDAPVRQISLQRLATVHDTNREMDIITARSHFRDTILVEPWILSRREQHKLHKDAIGETEHGRRKKRKLVERRQRLVEEEKAHEEVVQQEYDREESKRKEYAETARQAGLRLTEILSRNRKEDIQRISSDQSRLLAVVENGMTTELDKECDKKHVKRKRDRKSDALEHRDTGPFANTNDSFSALDSEKSALLKAAFG